MAVSVITLEIINPGDLDWTATQDVISHLAEVLPDCPRGNVNVKLVDEAEITDLNTQYTGNAYATDVLSVSYIEDGGSPINSDLGDVAICLPIARQQAEAAGTTLATELALLSLHGVLHIVGYDHQDPQQQTELNRLQRELMTKANLMYRDFSWK